MKKNKLMLFTFLAPAVLSFLVIYLYPVTRTVIMSFFRVPNIADRMSEWSFTGFINYKALMDSELFRSSFANLGYMWVWGGIAVMATALLFAIILSTDGARFKLFFRSAIYLPNIVAAVAMGTVWLQYVFNSQYGLLKSIFGFLGLKGLSEFPWTAAQNTRVSLTIAFSFGIVGFFMLIYMAAIDKIPDDYYEAATIEGAGIIKKFFKITLPLMKNVFRTTLVLWSTAILGFFTWSQVFSPFYPPDFKTVTPLVYMYFLVFTPDGQATQNINLKNAGAGAAIGVILTIITVIVFAIINLLIKEDNLEY